MANLQKSYEESNPETETPIKSFLTGIPLQFLISLRIPMSSAFSINITIGKVDYREHFFVFPTFPVKMENSTGFLQAFFLFFCDQNSPLMKPFKKNLFKIIGTSFAA